MPSNTKELDKRLERESAQSRRNLSVARKRLEEAFFSIGGSGEARARWLVKFSRSSIHRLRQDQILKLQWESRAFALGLSFITSQESPLTAPPQKEVHAAWLFLNLLLRELREGGSEEVGPLTWHGSLYMKGKIVSGYPEPLEMTWLDASSFSRMKHSAHCMLTIVDTYGGVGIADALLLVRGRSGIAPLVVGRR